MIKITHKTLFDMQSNGGLKKMPYDNYIIYQKQRFSENMFKS